MMTWAKTAAITAGFIGAFGIGIWTGPYLTRHAAPAIASVEPTAHVEPTPLDQPIAQRVAKHTRAVAVSNSRPAEAEFAAVHTAVAVDTPELHQRLKPLLKSGANMNLAAEGFRSAEQFATVAHASQNTDVPFLVLKHRMLNEGDTLVAAIRKSKPDVDAVVEADRARAEARSDITSLN
jgi:hypothetical protein